MPGIRTQGVFEHVRAKWLVDNGLDCHSKQVENLLGSATNAGAEYRSVSSERHGVPLKVVSEALGHSSIAITADVYSHVTPELRREAADAMDRALEGGAS